MESKSNLVSTIVADLPEEVLMESIEVLGKPFSTTSSLTKHKCEKGSEIVDAICEMRSSCIQVELSKRKLDLMQQQEARKAKEEQRKEKEEKHKARDRLFDEWECIQVIIKQLHKDMKIRLMKISSMIFNLILMH